MYKLLLSVSVGSLLLATQAFAQTGDAEEVGEVVVTASRVARSGFTAPTPTTIVGQEIVQQRGATNVADVINESPAFRPSQTPAASARGNGAGGNFLDLRGLNASSPTGVSRTLVLVDGRRHVPANAGGSVDLNMIPSSLIERTEVVTGGASAAWGSDAIAGVVNLILKDRLQGVQGAVTHGQAEEGDFQEWALNLAAGTSFAGGKGHAIIGVDYVNNLGIRDGRFSRDWGESAHAVVSLANPRTPGVPARVLLPDIRASDRLSPGGVIVGGPLDNIEFCGGQCIRTFTTGPFVAGNQMSGGGANNSNYGYHLFGGSNLVNPIERWSGMTRVNYEFSPALSIFGEYSHAESRFNAISSQRRDDGNLTIQRDNAFLPEAVRQQMVARNLNTITVGRLADDPGYSNYLGYTKQQTDRIALGAKGEVFGGWKWDAYYQWGRNNAVQQNTATNVANYNAAIDVVRNAAGQFVCRPGTALNAADPGCVPFNIFGQGSPSQEAIDYVSGVMVVDTTTKQEVAAFNITGEPFSLPAGPVSVATGVEYRKEQVRGVPDDFSAARRYDYGNNQPIAGSFNVKEIYGEIVVPLLRDLPAFERLDFNGAVRRTDYSTSGPVTTWKVGGTWDVIQDVRLRATKSRDIRAPNLRELFTGVASTRGNAANPWLGGNFQQDILTSGNSNLKPEVADTFTAGVVLQPRMVPGLRMSADYYDINIAGVITQLTPQLIVDRCFQGVQSFCDDITFGTGRNILQIRNRLQNFASLNTSGLDFEFSYRLPQPVFGGAVSLRALGTYVADMTTTDDGGPVDRAKQTVPEWAWNVSANYEVGKFNFNVQARYIGPTKIDVTLKGPNDEGYDPASTFSTSVNNRPAFTYLNLSMQYRLIDEPGRQLQLFGVLNNALDLAPPLGTVNITGGSLYDLVGRSFRVGARFSY